MYELDLLQQTHAQQTQTLVAFYESLCEPFCEPIGGWRLPVAPLRHIRVVQASVPYVRRCGIVCKCVSADVEELLSELGFG